MPSVTTFLLCAVALFSAGKASAATPELVNLPKLKPLGAQAQEPAASSRVAVLELSTSQSIDPNMARRVAVELTAALKAHGRYPSIVKVGDQVGDVLGADADTHEIAWKRLLVFIDACVAHERWELDNAADAAKTDCVFEDRD